MSSLESPAKPGISDNIAQGLSMQRTVTLESTEFRALAHELSDFAARYLEELPLMRAYPQSINGAEIERLFASDPPLDGMGKAAFDLLPQVFENSRPASPRFFGYVFGSGEPIAALGQFAASVLHQNATAWRSGPSANTIERTVVRWLGLLAATETSCSFDSGFGVKYFSSGSPPNSLQTNGKLFCHFCRLFRASRYDEVHPESLRTFSDLRAGETAKP
jgi:hypothetical protein